MTKHTRSRTLLGALAALSLASACFGSQPAPAAAPVMAGTASPAAGTSATASPLVPARRGIVTGDLLAITVFAAPELSRETRVASDGTISMPLLGVVTAAGRTLRELEVALEDTLRQTYMRDPRVAVEIKEAAPRPIYVVGEVNEPGAFTQTGEAQLTVLRAIAMARGLAPGAAGKHAVLMRPRADGEPQHIPVNLDDAVRGRAADLVLQPNDVLFIPKNTQRAVTLGMIDAALRLVTFRAVF